ncbi:MAG: EamA family transporter [Clostridia bacterium]|nr:EamA family transporter [Clostridia bacterium]
MPLFWQIVTLLCMSILANVKMLITGKAHIHNTIAALRFNALSFSVVGITFLVFLIGSPISALTLMTAVLYALGTVAFQVFYVMALEKGPISVVVLIVNFSSMIAAVFGTVLFQETFGCTDVIGLCLVVLSLLLTVKGGKEKQDNTGFVYAVISALAGAAALLVQRYHQKTEFADERNGFLCVAYLFAAAVTVSLLWLGRKRKTALPCSAKRFAGYGIATGAVLAVYQGMLIFLSGKVNSIFLYPVLTAFVMSIGLILCRVVFREKMGLKQTFGFLIGSAAVVMIAC